MSRISAILRPTRCKLPTTDCRLRGASNSRSIVEPDRATKIEGQTIRRRKPIEEENQKLRDEINCLKDEEGKPNIKGNKKKE